MPSLASYALTFELFELLKLAKKCRGFRTLVLFIICNAVTTYYQSAQFDGSENSPIVIADSPVKKRTHPEEKNRYKFIHYKYVIQTMIITFISFSTFDDSHLEYHSESSSDERYPKSMFLQAALNYHQYFTL